jgi:dihydrofolate reductase
MRKLTLGMNVSLDGFVAGDGGDVNWIFPNFSPELMVDTQQLLAGFDAILMGRKNYEEMAASWPTADGPMADVMNSVEKVVFSTTLTTLEWNNSRISAAEPEEEIALLKSLPGGPIGASGGAQFAQYLSSHGLVDEYRLTIHPIMLGSGIPIFNSRIGFDIVESVDYPHGVTVRKLRPKPDAAAS